MPKVPIKISKNFRKIDINDVKKITASLKKHYFARPIYGRAIATEEYLSSKEGKEDLLEYLERRLDNFRQTVIPWLNDAKPLCGANILEIGCGTGCSTVALAEQGARIIAVDIDEESLAVAEDSCRIYGLRADFVNAKVSTVHNLFSHQQFDFIFFCIIRAYDSRRTDSCYEDYLGNAFER